MTKMRQALSIIKNLYQMMANKKAPIAIPIGAFNLLFAREKITRLGSYVDAQSDLGDVAYAEP